MNDPLRRRVLEVAKLLASEEQERLAAWGTFAEVEARPPPCWTSFPRYPEVRVDKFDRRIVLIQLTQQRAHRKAHKAVAVIQSQKVH